MTGNTGTTRKQGSRETGDAAGGIASRARFDRIRYAQVWEDADVLLAALAPRPGATLVSIASAGDNTLALLTADPAEVVAVDLSEAQLACLALRMEAYRLLDHTELLELIGSRPSRRRRALLWQATAGLPPGQRAFWAARARAVERLGAGGVGRFENYFRIFRRYVLPMVHGRRRTLAWLQPHPAAAREATWREWDTPRWRLMLRAFFSRRTMGRLGRDPAFFDFAEGSLPDQVAARARNALVDQDPAENPYLAWILTGRHGDALPLALRPEHFNTIRDRLERVRLLHGPLSAFDGTADGWNLSDVFEYMSPAEHEAAYAGLLAHTRPGGRLAYWNMMVPRRAPASLAHRVRAHDTAALHAADRAFFYRALVVEERLP